MCRVIERAAEQAAACLALEGLVWGSLKGEPGVGGRECFGLDAA